MGYKSVKNALPSTERTPMAPRYELFIMPACPYCQKVLRYMERRGIEMPLRDVTSDPDAREELVRVGGKSQVPCLFIDGAPLYESDDIIAHLQRHVVGA